ncbi:FG-GAP-like repeat-containing protein [Actinopolymorpha sp. NPDC004070]|uniref:FG-GAP-like repeat-containing protein n=1 Tax=Actinopolymorpha sp. NPDC004070 TaxID=3154548 RepID=UPI0033A8C9F7
MPSPTGNLPGRVAGDYAWVGRFGGQPRDQLLLFDPGDYFRTGKDWWVGSIQDATLRWTRVGNTAGFGNSPEGCAVWSVRTAPGQDGILFYYPGDRNWWLGRTVNNQLQWNVAGNTRGFGQVWDGRPFWTGDFTGDGRTDIMFYYPGDRNWWLGRSDGNALQWNVAGNTSGFGQVWDNRPFWTGDFTGDGRTDIMFYSPGDKNWWLGRSDGNTLQWGYAGNTSGFGQIWDGRPFWTGDFTGDGRTDIMFYYPGDKNWWLGRSDGGQLRWSVAANTSGFGQIWDGRPFWTGDFTGDGRTDIMFYYPGDKNWWLGRSDGNTLQWSVAANTSGFGQIWDGRPFWTGDFTGDGRTDVLFYTPGDRNWWLGNSDGAQLNWTRVGVSVPVYSPPPPPPPPPPAQVRVPNVVGVTEKAANDLLGAVGLGIGFVWNPTGEIDMNRLKVVAQDPPPGTLVNQGSKVNLNVTAERPPGLKSLKLTNLNTDNRSVWLHHWSAQTNSWEELGELARGANKTVSFESGYAHLVVAVDKGLINCTDGSPTNLSCQRFEVGVLGDSNGVAAEAAIY